LTWSRTGTRHRTLKWLRTGTSQAKLKLPGSQEANEEDQQGRSRRQRHLGGEISLVGVGTPPAPPSPWVVTANPPPCPAAPHLTGWKLNAGQGAGHSDRATGNRSDAAICVVLLRSCRLDRRCVAVDDRTKSVHIAIRECLHDHVSDNRTTLQQDALDGVAIDAIFDKRVYDVVLEARDCCSVLNELAVDHCGECHRKLDRRNWRRRRSSGGRRGCRRRRRLGWRGALTLAETVARVGGLASPAIANPRVAQEVNIASLEGEIIVRVQGIGDFSCHQVARSGIDDAPLVYAPIFGLTEARVSGALAISLVRIMRLASISVGYGLADIGCVGKSRWRLLLRLLLAFASCQASACAEAVGLVWRVTILAITDPTVSGEAIIACLVREEVIRVL